MSDIDIIIQDLLRIYNKYMVSLRQDDRFSEANMKSRDQLRWDILTVVGELDHEYNLLASRRNRSS